MKFEHKSTTPLYTSARNVDNKAKKKKKNGNSRNRRLLLAWRQKKPRIESSSSSPNVIFYQFPFSPFIKSAFFFSCSTRFVYAIHGISNHLAATRKGIADGSLREKRFLFEELFIIIRKYIKYFMNEMDLSFQLNLSKVIWKERETKMTEEKWRKYRIKNVNRDRKIERHCWSIVGIFLNRKYDGRVYTILTHGQNRKILGRKQHLSLRTYKYKIDKVEVTTWR